MRFCELKEKDVINRCDCKKLGQICDLVIDECSGQICSIIVPGPPRLCGLLCPDQEYIMQYFSDRNIRSMPGFIGYTGWNDSVVPCKFTPRWCPRKKGGV